MQIITEVCTQTNERRFIIEYSDHDIKLLSAKQIKILVDRQKHTQPYDILKTLCLLAKWVEHRKGVI